MEDRQAKIPPDAVRPQTGFRSQPLPLADRRRMLRQSDPADQPGYVITDWASI